MTKILISLILGLHLGSVKGSGTYTLEDLEVLVTEGNYQEYFLHALDIRPSQRDERWRMNTSRMADLKAKQILASPKIESSDLKEIEALFEWPHLQKDDVFKLRRGQIGQKYFKQCLNKDPSCLKEMVEFWKKNSDDPELGMSFARLGLEHTLPQEILRDFLTPVLRSPVSEFYCKEAFVLNEAWKELARIHLKLGDGGNFTQKIDRAIHPNCLPYLNSLAQKKLREPDTEVDRELAYAILAAQGKNTEKIQDIFFTLYILENPSRGENFNLAWNRLQELGKSPDRRERVLNDIRSMPFLPDAIAESLDVKKKKVILKHLRANFPEYLDHYFRSCVDFYGGKGPFPKGNPTQNCEKLMKSELAGDLFEKSQIEKFHEVIKI